MPCYTCVHHFKRNHFIIRIILCILSKDQKGPYEWWCTYLVAHCGKSKWENVKLQALMLISALMCRFQELLLRCKNDLVLHYFLRMQTKFMNFSPAESIFLIFFLFLIPRLKVFLSSLVLAWVPWVPGTLRLGQAVLWEKSGLFFTLFE